MENNPLARLMTALADISAKVQSHEESIDTLSRMALRLTEAQSHEAACRELLQAEVERLAEKAHTRKPRKPRSDKGKKRASRKAACKEAAK